MITTELARLHTPIEGDDFAFWLLKPICDEFAVFVQLELTEDWYATATDSALRILVAGASIVRESSLSYRNCLLWRTADSDCSFGTITATTTERAKMFSYNALEHTTKSGTHRLPFLK